MLSIELEIAIQVAAEEAQSRRHEFFGLEHMLYALLHDAHTAAVIAHCSGDVPTLRKQVETFLAAEVQSVPGEEPVQAQPTIGLHRVIQRAALHVRGAGKKTVTGANVLVAMYAEEDSHAVFFLLQGGVTRLDVVSYLSHGGEEAGPMQRLPSAGGDDDDDDDDNEEGEAGSAASGEKGGPLQLYCLNLNDEARAGRIDPLVGRDNELQRMAQVLLRRRKNNPLLVGDSGTGKTAIVAGLAKAIVEGKAPPPLLQTEVWSLDLGALLAGTK